MTSSVVPETSDHSVMLNLARLEARRLTLHPVMLVGWALLLVWFGADLLNPGPITSFDSVTLGTTFAPGLFCVLAAHMVTTRDLRAGTADLLGSVPATREQRVVALLLAAWVPALIALIANLAIRQYFVWQDVYVEVPGLAHVAQGPVTVLGGSLLGIMLGVWFPQRVTPILAMAALVAGTYPISEADATSLFSVLFSWPDWSTSGDDSVWYQLKRGNPGAHVGYLLGLCGMAAAAAWLRVTPHRWQAIALGLVCLAGAVWGGVAQLP